MTNTTKITRKSNKAILSLLLLGSLAASTITVNVNASFLDQIGAAWTKGQKDAWPTAIWNMVTKEAHKLKKHLPNGIREVFIGALATMIGKYIFTVLVKNPIEVAKNKLNAAKKLFYISQAQSLLKNEDFLEKVCEKALKLGLPLTTPEQIAMVALYLMDDSELTTEQLMNEETIDKIVSGEVTIDKKQLKKLIQSILKQAADDKKADNKLAAGKDKDDEQDDEDEENEQVTAKDNKKTSQSDSKSNNKQNAKLATLDKSIDKENDKTQTVTTIANNNNDNKENGKNTDKENMATKTAPVTTDNKNNTENNAGENVANKTEDKALPTAGNTIVMPTVSPAN